MGAAMGAWMLLLVEVVRCACVAWLATCLNHVHGVSARNTAAGTPMHGDMEEAVGVFERELYSHVGQTLLLVPAAVHRAAVRRHSRTHGAEI